MEFNEAQPIFVPPHAGKKLDFLSVTHKLTGQQTSGTYYLFESVFGPGDGNGLHIHRCEDEVGYVLEGALEIRLADQTLAVEAGSIAHLPKNIPHAIRNPLETTSRYLFMTARPMVRYARCRNAGWHLRRCPAQENFPGLLYRMVGVIT